MSGASIAFNSPRLIIPLQTLYPISVLTAYPLADPKMPGGMATPAWPSVSPIPITLTPDCSQRHASPRVGGRVHPHHLQRVMPGSHYPSEKEGVHQLSLGRWP